MAARARRAAQKVCSSHQRTRRTRGCCWGAERLGNLSCPPAPPHSNAPAHDRPVCGPGRSSAPSLMTKMADLGVSLAALRAAPRGRRNAANAGALGQQEEGQWRFLGPQRSWAASAMHCAGRPCERVPCVWRCAYVVESVVCMIVDLRRLTDCYHDNDARPPAGAHHTARDKQTREKTSAVSRVRSKRRPCPRAARRRKRASRAVAPAASTGGGTLASWLRAPRGGAARPRPPRRCPARAASATPATKAEEVVNG